MSVVLWTAAEAAAATGGAARGDWAVRGISIDSRDLAPGDLFVALADRRDGHGFVAAALAKGAAAALVSRRPEGVGPDAPLLVVDDVQAALEALGRAGRARAKARVAALTGSVGKTSSKDMLAHVLSRQGPTHAAVKSFNNHWGVPLTLARMPRQTRFAVIEIGMNHPGEIAPLARMARPDIGLVTTVAAVHMAAFSTLDEVANAKAELFQGMAGGTAILNRDDATFSILAAAARRSGAGIATFGTSGEAGFQLVEARIKGDVTLVRARFGDRPLLFKIGAAGRHFALNALAVLAAVDALGADVALAALDLGHWRAPEGRGRRRAIALDPGDATVTFELIDDAYNANPTSMAAAFEVLAAAVPVDGVGRRQKGRRVAFLSDMLELGEAEAERHRALARNAALDRVDVVHCAGPLMRHFFGALPAHVQGEWHEDAHGLAARAHRLVDAGDVVLVKGSKGSRASLVVDALAKLGKAGTRR